MKENLVDKIMQSAYLCAMIYVKHKKKKKSPRSVNLTSNYW